jgi:hypothetical protein
MGPTKPTSKADLVPGYEVGAVGWLQTVRALLEQYGVPPGQPVRQEELRKAELRLARALPRDWAELLFDLGPIDLDGLRFLPPADIRSAQDLWFRDHLSAGERTDLQHLVCVAETGSDNMFVYDIRSGLVRLASHDPGGIFEAIPSVSDLVRLALVGLAAGRYGWPDPDVADLVDRTRDELLEEWSRLEVSSRGHR